MKILGITTMCYDIALVSCSNRIDFFVQVTILSSRILVYACVQSLHTFCCCFLLFAVNHWVKYSSYLSKIIRKNSCRKNRKGKKSNQSFLSDWRERVNVIFWERSPTVFMPIHLLFWPFEVIGVHVNMNDYPLHQCVLEWFAWAAWERRTIWPPPPLCTDIHYYSIYIFC